MKKITMMVDGDQLVLSEDMDLYSIVRELTHKGVISADTYDMFITEERNYGGIPFKLSNGKFEFEYMDCSVFDDGVLLPYNAEEKMYLSVYNIINALTVR